MAAQDLEILEWTEFKPERYGRCPSRDAIGHSLYENFSNYVSVSFPTPVTEGKWEFTPQGWVGTIPVSDSVTVSILPKAPLVNVFRMWEYAYRLSGFHFLKGVVGSQSLDEFYQNVAGVFASKVLDRSRKGLYRTYIGQTERLPYVTGKLNIRKLLAEPWRVDPECSFEEHTADVEENQILCWTLSVVAKSGLCNAQVLSKVRRAYRELLGCITPEPLTAKSCMGRLYNRLNDDYEPLHGLCRFFLEHRGPTHKHGDRVMMPFLVDMARLFELFVAEWLKLNLPPEFELKEQHTVNFGSHGEVQFRMDAVIRNRKAGTPLFVLDTKYKVPDSAGSSDIHEIRSYAESIGCSEAVLVYPVDLSCPLDMIAGKIRTRSLSFQLDQDLNESGISLINKLLQPV